MDNINWTEVESSNISRIAYDESDGKIIVEFKDGGQYAYDDCSPQLFNQFRMAESAGKFFHSNIKAGHTAERLN